MKKQITVEVLIDAPIEKVWKFWTGPEHIVKWCFASDDWHAPNATNDSKVGGRFLTRMEAKDGSDAFDFGGVYTTVEENKKIAYTMDGNDKRKVEIVFEKRDGKCRIVESFDPEDENTLELQRIGWQAILDSFKNYVEASK